MDVGDEVDRIMRELRDARLQRSPAGGPGQSALPDVDVPVSAVADGAAAFVATAGPASGVPFDVDNGSTPPGPGVVGPDVVVAETGGQSTSLDAHALARLEAASDLAELLGLGFHLGGAVERIAYGASEGRAGVESLREASWLIGRYIALVEQRPVGAGLHAASVRLGRSGEAIAGLRAISAALEAERPSDTPLPAGEQLVVAEPPSESERALSADREPSQVPEAVPDQRSFGFEVALMAVRWSIIVVAVIAIVLALTLIGERF